MSSSPNNNVQPTANQFSVGKPELVLFGSPIQIRTNRATKRSSNFVKTNFDEPNQEEHQLSARMSRAEARRGSSFVRAMSEDVGGETTRLLVRSPKPDYRRGSSFIRTVDDSIVEQLIAGRSAKVDIRRCSSFIKTTEDINEDSGESTKTNIRRCSSFVKNPEDSTEDTLSIGRSTKPDIRRGSSFIRTSDDSNEDNLSSGRTPRTEIRRGSSFIRMISEEINNEEMHATGRLSSKPDSRRGSGVSKMLSEDSNDDMQSRRSSRADMRRGSSLSKMISEEQDEEEENQYSEQISNRSENSDKTRKAMDNTNKQSLESISEYKTQTFSSASLYPSVEYSSVSVESPISDLSQDIAIRSCNESNKDGSNNDGTYINSSLSYISWIESVNSGYSANNATKQVADNDNKSGEWSNFWSNYNSSRNEYFSSPYLCPSNSGEDMSFESNASTQRGSTDKIINDNVVLTMDEVNEALDCTQRLTDILRGAIKRSETEATISKHDSDAPNVSLILLLFIIKYIF